jgi:hypothetical protein
MQQKSKQAELSLIGRNKGETGRSPKGVEEFVAGCHQETSGIEHSLMEEVIEKENLWR